MGLIVVQVEGPSVDTEVCIFLLCIADMLSLPYLRLIEDLGRRTVGGLRSRLFPYLRVRIGYGNDLLDGTLLDGLSRGLWEILRRKERTLHRRFCLLLEPRQIRQRKGITCIKGLNVQHSSMHPVTHRDSLAALLPRLGNFLPVQVAKGSIPLAQTLHGETVQS